MRYISKFSLINEEVMQKKKTAHITDLDNTLVYD